MSRLVFLLEEHSMKVFLETFLPLHFPDLPFLCIEHDGKRDLEKSIPRKLRAWSEPGVQFIVVRDADGGDCLRLKKRLVDSCKMGRRPDALVRIVCQELEAWYLGDPEALADAFEDPRLRTIGGRAKFREPDRLQRPSDELEKLVPAFQKVSGARRMARHASPDRTASPSFRVFLEGVRRQQSRLGR